MPCPKCGHILITEDGVVYCDECLYVVSRKDDPEFESPPEHKPIPKLGRPFKEKTELKKKHKRRKHLAKEKVCTTERCSNPAYSKGKCKNCYQREWQRRKFRAKSLTSKKKCVLCPRNLFAKKLCKMHFGKVYGIEYEKLYEGKGG